jgi:AbrB family looped-hinge helix DNA binding protein
MQEAAIKTTMSKRGQIVVPREIRERMGIVPGSRLEWRIIDGLIVVMPIPSDPVRASVGILKDRGLRTEDLLAERRKERQIR